MMGQCDECGDHWLVVTRDTLQSVSTVEDDGDNPAPHDWLRSRSGHPCYHHRLLNIASPWPPGHHRPGGPRAPVPGRSRLPPPEGRAAARPCPKDPGAS